MGNGAVGTMRCDAEQRKAGASRLEITPEATSQKNCLAQFIPGSVTVGAILRHARPPLPDEATNASQINGSTAQSMNARKAAESPEDHHNGAHSSGPPNKHMRNMPMRGIVMHVIALKRGGISDPFFCADWDMVYNITNMLSRMKCHLARIIWIAENRMQDPFVLIFHLSMPPVGRTSLYV